MDPLGFAQSRLNPSNRSAIFTWKSDAIIAEELVTPFVPKGYSHLSPLECWAVVVRLHASSYAAGFLAEIAWDIGHRWADGFGDPGSGIEARTWRDADWNVTIGTEDAESLAYRASHSIWMPSRLAHYFEFSPEAAVRIGCEAISIQVPELRAGDRCQFQFTIASGRRGVDDVSTWLAVDQRWTDLLLAGDCEPR